MRTIRFNNALRSIAVAGSAVMFIVPSLAQSTQFGECVTTATRSVLFAPGTPQSEIDRIVGKIRRQEGSTIIDYEAAARWSLTSFGNTGAIGTAARFGYSFVSDGVEIPDTGLGGGPSNLQSTLTGQFGGNAALWRQKFRQMFDAWGSVSGLRYDEVGDDGAPLHFFPGQIGQRGDLRISGLVMTEPAVLAYNFFPDDGDMVINTQHNWGVAGNDYRFLRNTLGHEHGHGMGLAHVIPLNDTKLMEPVLTTAFDGPQNDDIQGCQFLYGDRVEDNDGIATATDIGMVTSGQAVELLAVERPSDRDWFRVEIPAGFNLTVRVEPQGGSYMVGPQGGFPRLRNANAINNLRLSAYLADGTTLLGTSNIGGLGFPETLQSITRPQDGIVSVKVDVSTIREDIQRYRLVFLLDGATTTFSPNSYTLISGNEIGGGLFSLQGSDDFRLKLYPLAQSQVQRAYIEYEVATTSTILNPTSIILGYEGSASSTNIRRTISAFDFVAGAWVQISQGQSTMLETTQETLLSNPARFVSASGQMRIRVYNIANGPILGFPYETATDWIYWRLTQ